MKNLHVHFETYEGTAEVINGVDLTIHEGEKVGLVGETGCGKSVTAKSILGLLNSPPARIPEGEINYRGRDLLSLSDRERHAFRGDEISMIMQDPMTSLNPVYTVGEQMLDVMKWQGSHRLGVVEWARDKFRDHSEKRQQAIDMLDKVHISAPERVFDSYPVELSGGMRQRVLIAIALLAEPDLLIADEPGTAIDVTTEKKILGLLDDLVEDIGTSILYITHDLGVALAVTETVNVMYSGEIVEQAPTKRLFEKPRHPYTRGLFDSVPKLSTGIGAGIEGQLPGFIYPPSGCRFANRCPHAAPECEEFVPYRRDVESDHGVACHLYDGPATEQRHRSVLAEQNVDIGEPPTVGSSQESDEPMSGDSL